jgi:hypothetical protein
MPGHHTQALLQSLRLALCLGALATITPGHSLREQGNSSNITFRNIDPSVGYVGSKACAAASCHEDIARAYPTIPMGHSMALANIPAELARAPQPVMVFNEANKHYYEVYQEGGELYQSAYELDKKGRKIYRIAHEIDWVVGSALTGYSYLFRIGPWIFQVPLSYYSHPEKWGFSPG